MDWRVLQLIIKTDEKHTGTPERKWVPGGRIEIPYIFFFFVWGKGS